MENRICLDYYQGGCNYSGYHCSFHRSVVCCDRTVFCIKCPSLATAITLCTTNTMETIDVNLIEKSLAKLYITPQTRIWDLVPGIDVLYDEILTVYVPTFFNQEINIFKLSIFEITSKFFTVVWSYPEYRRIIDFTDFDIRIKIFLDNLIIFAILMRNELKKPKDQRNMYAMTIMLALEMECSARASVITTCCNQTFITETIDAVRLEKSLANLNITRRTRIIDLVPGIDSFYVEIMTIYVPTFFNQEINIFKLTIADIAAKYFTVLWAYPGYRKIIDFTDFDKRIKIFIDNLTSFVISMREESKKPKEKRIVFAMTIMLALETESSSPESAIEEPEPEMKTNAATIMDTIDVVRIENSLANLNITRSTRITDLVPGIDTHLDEIMTIYVPSFFKQEFNIFKLSVYEITTKFFTILWSYPEYRQIIDFTDFNKRIKIFIENLKLFVISIREELKKPQDKRTMHAVTIMLALETEDTLLSTAIKAFNNIIS
ncbi:uncharacterized protein LOC113788921 [Dermatophagoides pteronyssinus]|uniref:uncharacterized protein LOC113788921 n=1 Tax=Dermatophagoides pteronyssinus TaxID=6956 RepID=UPI003F6700F2